MMINSGTAHGTCSSLAQAAGRIKPSASSISRRTRADTQDPLSHRVRRHSPATSSLEWQVLSCSKTAVQPGFRGGAYFQPGQRSCQTHIRWADPTPIVTHLWPPNFPHQALASAPHKSAVFAPVLHSNLPIFTPPSSDLKRSWRIACHTDHGTLSR